MRCRGGRGLNTSAANSHPHLPRVDRCWRLSIIANTLKAVYAMARVVWCRERRLRCEFLSRNGPVGNISCMQEEATISSARHATFMLGRRSLPKLSVVCPAAVCYWGIVIAVAFAKQSTSRGGHISHDAYMLYTLLERKGCHSNFRTLMDCIPNIGLSSIKLRGLSRRSPLFEPICQNFVPQASPLTRGNRW